MIGIKNIDGTRIIEFNSEKSTNPFSKALMYDVVSAVTEAERDESVKAVVLTGGDAHSFSAGGDFSEVRLMKTASDVEEWIEDVLQLYYSVLKVSKPCVAAVDNYAIGIGFQLALMCDYRIGTPDVKFILPELKGGIACTLGGFLLECYFGRGVMQKIIYECSTIDSQSALGMNLLNQLASDDLIEAALKVAKDLSSYPRCSFEVTKKLLNNKLMSELDQFKANIIQSHTIAIEAMSGQAYYKKILEKS
jgi:carboxymethylproline synthase